MEQNSILIEKAQAGEKEAREVLIEQDEATRQRTFFKSE